MLITQGGKERGGVEAKYTPQHEWMRSVVDWLWAKFAGALCTWVEGPQGRDGYLQVNGWPPEVELKISETSPLRQLVAGALLAIGGHPSKK